MGIPDNQLAALKTELETDPSGVGYTHTPGDTNTYAPGVVTKINAATIPNQQISTLNSGQLLGAVVATEYIALTDAQKSAWNMIMTAAVSGVNLWDPEIEAMMLLIWTAGTTTRTNLSNLRQKNGSRAEELFGEGTVVDHHDVKRALMLP